LKFAMKEHAKVQDASPRREETGPPRGARLRSQPCRGENVVGGRGHPGGEVGAGMGRGKGKKLSIEKERGSGIRVLKLR